MPSPAAAIAVSDRLELKAHTEDVGIVHFLTTRGGLRIQSIVVLLEAHIERFIDGHPETLIHGNTNGIAVRQIMVPSKR